MLTEQKILTIEEFFVNPEDIYNFKYTNKSTNISTVIDYGHARKVESLLHWLYTLFIGIDNTLLSYESYLNLSYEGLATFWFIPVSLEERKRHPKMSLAATYL